MSVPTMRDNAWLQSRLHYLWDHYYGDAPVGYPITAVFGRAARYRYGSIFNQGKQCRILINGLFAHPDVPEFVVDATLVHELAHYVHGYGSGLAKLHSHPHRGGVIDKEMEQRGCLHLEDQAFAWRRSYWQAFYADQMSDTVARDAARDQRLKDRWRTYTTRPGYRSLADVNDRAQQIARRFGLDEVPFDVDWLLASGRRTGLSYRFREDNVVRIHPLLSAPDVPDEVIDYEVAYWLASTVAGSRWESIEDSMREAGIWTRAQKAIQWRRKVWPRYRPKHFVQAAPRLATAVADED